MFKSPNFVIKICLSNLYLNFHLTKAHSLYRALHTLPFCFFTIQYHVHHKDCDNLSKHMFRYKVCYSKNMNSIFLGNGFFYMNNYKTNNLRCLQLYYL